MKFIETMAVTDGKIRNIRYHIERMSCSAGISGIDLSEIYRATKAGDTPAGYEKFRLVYDSSGILSSEVSHYTVHRVNYLIAMAIPDDFDYNRKYLDRSALNSFSTNCPKGSIPMLIRNGFVTDTTYTNLCFKDIDGTWHTPSTPLLRGTMRQSLIDQGGLQEREIRVEEIREFCEVALINALLPLGKVVLPITSVNFGIFGER